MAGIPEVGKTVFLVEDDQPVRSLIRRSLEGAGYRVEAGSGEEALGWAQNTGGTLSLLIADTQTPGLDGFSLEERFAERHPETRVLLVSGFAGESMSRLGSPELAEQAVLLKPFTRTDLLRTVRSLLTVGDACRRTTRRAGSRGHRNRA